MTNTKLPIAVIRPSNKTSFFPPVSALADPECSVRRFACFRFRSRACASAVKGSRTVKLIRMCVWPGRLAFRPFYPLSTNDKSHICCAHSRKSPTKDQPNAVRECAIDSGRLIAAFGQPSAQCNAEIVLDFVQPALPNNAARKIIYRSPGIANELQIPI